MKADITNPAWNPTGIVIAYFQTLGTGGWRISISRLVSYLMGSRVGQPVSEKGVLWRKLPTVNDKT